MGSRPWGRADDWLTTLLDDPAVTDVMVNGPARSGSSAAARCTAAAWSSTSTAIEHLIEQVVAPARAAASTAPPRSSTPGCPTGRASTP